MYFLFSLFSATNLPTYLPKREKNFGKGDSLREHRIQNKTDEASRQLRGVVLRRRVRN